MISFFLHALTVRVGQFLSISYPCQKNILHGNGFDRRWRETWLVNDKYATDIESNTFTISQSTFVRRKNTNLGFQGAYVDRE